MKRSTNINDILSRKNKSNTSGKQPFDLLGQGNKLVEDSKNRKGATAAKPTQADLVEQEEIVTSPVVTEQVLEPVTEVHVEVKPLIQAENVEPEPLITDHVTTSIESVVEVKEIVKAYTPEVKKETLVKKTEAMPIVSNMVSKKAMTANIDFNLCRRLSTKFGPEKAMYVVLLLELVDSYYQFGAGQNKIASVLNVTDRSVKRILSSLVDAKALTIIKDFDPVSKSPRVYQVEID